jgi:hypothetical protein
MFNSQIRDLQRVQDEKDSNNPIFLEYIDCIKKHDYSYMMSDDDRVWQSGTKAEKHIQSLIAKLIDNVLSLKVRSLYEVKQQFNDVDSNGNDLTHRVIRSWFMKFEN